MRRFRLSPSARGDLADIRHHVARDKPDAAARLVRALYDRFQMLGRSPLLGESRPDLGENARVFTVGNYVIVYRPLGDRIEVSRVVSGSRDWESLF